MSEYESPYDEAKRLQARIAELEAEVEKLRATNSEWQTGHRAMVKRAQKVEAEVEALREDYFKRLSGAHDAIEKAEAERDRLAKALRKIQRTGRDEFHQNIARAALEGKAE